MPLSKIQTSEMLDTPNLGRRNLIINGNFDVWQRGTSFSNVNNVYTADRMHVVSGGGTTGDSVTQQAFTAGQTDVPGEPTYHFRFGAGSTSSNKVVHHRIEDVRTGAGRIVTLSFWGKASTAHSSSIELGQNFGSGGSSQVVPASQSYSLTTSWQKFTFNVTLPSISGKTIGTSSYLYIAFIRSLPASNVNIDIAQMQLEIGSTATDFEHRSFDEELILCQRYYQKSYVYETVPGTATQHGFWSTGGHQGGTSGGYVEGIINFERLMRTTPTVTLYDHSGNSNKCARLATGTARYANESISTSNLNARGVTMYSTSGTAAGIVQGHYTASAEL